MIGYFFPIVFFSVHKLTEQKKVTHKDNNKNQIYRYRNTHRFRHTETHSFSDTETETHNQTVTERKTERDTGKEKRKKQRHRSETQKDIHTQTVPHKNRHIHTEFTNLFKVARAGTALLTMTQRAVLPFQD